MTAPTMFGMVARRFIVFFLCVCTLVCSAPCISFAQQSKSFSVIPLVINEKGKPRDIFKSHVTLRNLTQQKRTIYADVVQFDAETGEVPTEFGPGAPIDRSLAHWIEITRGSISLGPEEEVQIPYLIHVNVKAVPGLYHAQIIFREGSTRAEAASEPRAEERVTVTFEIQSSIVERLNLGTFFPEQSVVGGKDARFQFLLENSGTNEITPQGEIRIYDRAGKEVGSIPVNPDGASISPTKTAQLASVWNAAGRFGKYKAFLDVSYGQGGVVHDTVYFWVVPWRQLLVGLLLVVIALVITTYLIHARLSYARVRKGASRVSGSEESVTVIMPDAHVHEPEITRIRAEAAPRSVAHLRHAMEHGDNRGDRNTPRKHVAASHVVTLSSPHHARARTSGHVVTLAKKK